LATENPCISKEGRVNDTQIEYDLSGRQAEPLTLDEFGHWLNGWGYDELRTATEGERSRNFKDGYQSAIRDAYDIFDRLHPGWAEDKLTGKHYRERSERAALSPLSQREGTKK
jgi:hypothetical protein